MFETQSHFIPIRLSYNLRRMRLVVSGWGKTSDILRLNLKRLRSDVKFETILAYPPTI